MQPELGSEISKALTLGKGVVALESTLIAHGLPWPQNRETALAAEQAVRDSGAVPATIAVLGGRLRIGLTAAEIEALAQQADPEQGPLPMKASRRDLAVAVARGLNAATTVSATIWIARRAGIRVAATGGLGGVHREASVSFDVSTDLDELAAAQGFAIVCSGVKSILDISATLEFLETRGVLLIGYRTDEFPAFTCTTSGLPLEHRVDTVDAAAALISAHRAMGTPGAIVLAQPVPTGLALDPAVFERALREAMQEAERRGVRGKPLTPFLLNQIRLATDGRSLQANQALIVENARLAGSLAHAMARNSYLTSREHPRS